MTWEIGAEIAGDISAFFTSADFTSLSDLFELEVGLGHIEADDETPFTLLVATTFVDDDIEQIKLTNNDTGFYLINDKLL